MKHLSRLKLPFLSLRRSFLKLLAMTLATLLLGGGFAAAGSAQLAQKGLSPIALGIVSGQQDDTMELMLDRLTTQADVFPNVRLVMLASEEEAREQVQDGTISAALVLPKELISWVNGQGGENPLLIVKDLSSVEYAVFNTIGNSFLRMLTVAQRGVSLALQAYQIAQAPQISYDVVWMGTNLAYLNLAIDQMTRFDDQLVSGPQSLSYGIHTILCICFCFLLLLTPMLHERLSLRKNEPWIRRMGSVGITPWHNALGQLVVCTFGYALLLILFTGGFLLLASVLHETVHISPLLLPAILLGAVFLAGFSLFFANLGTPLFGGLLCGLISILGLITAGGLLPKVLLPTVLQMLSALSPILWLRDVFAASLYNPEMLWEIPALALLLCGAALFAGSFFICRYFGRASR